MTTPVDLDGMSVLVTGASGGLGSRIAARLGEAGARLTLVARDRARLGGLGIAEAATVPLDLTLPEAPAAAVQAAVDAHGRLDGVVHAAGVVAFGPLADIDDDVVDELFLINTLVPIRLVRAALPHLDRSGGSGGSSGSGGSGEEVESFVVTISGVVAETPQPGMAAYSASKAASRALAGALGGELRRSRIRVLDVRPPHTETGLASRPVAGTAPRMPQGKDPQRVADRIVRAIADGEWDLPTSAF